MLVAAAVVGASAAIAGASEAAAGGRAPLSPVGQLSAGQSAAVGSPVVSSDPAGHAAGDVTPFIWDNGAGTGLWNNGINWVSNTAPATSNDDPTFDNTVPGSYTTNNNLAATQLGLLTVNRALATDTTTVTGGYSGLGARIVNGKLVIDGGTSTIGTTTSTVIDFQLGTTATSNAAVTFQGSAVVNYTDMLAGFNAGATTNITVTGANTKLQPINATYDSFFGGNAGTSTVLVDAGASVVANFIRSSVNGTFQIRNGSSVTAKALDAIGPGAALFGSVDASTMNVEISGASTLTANSITNPDDDANNMGQVLIGYGSKTNTTVTISGGSTVRTAVFGISAGDPSAGRAAAGSNPAVNGTTPANIAPGTATVTLTGAGSKIVSSDFLNVGSLANFGNVYSNGTSTFNIQAGGKAYGETIFVGAAQPTTFTTTNFADASPVATTVALGPSINVLNITGTGSLLRAGTETVTDGALLFVFGSNSTSLINVNTGGRIETGYFADGAFDGETPDNVATINIGSGGVISANDRIEVGNGSGTAGIGSHTTINIAAGGALNNAEAIVSGIGLGGSATFNVNGGVLNTTFYQTGGYGGGTAGTGASLLNVTNGGVANITEGIAMEVRGSQVDKIDPLHAVINVSGANSKLNVTGTPAAGATPAVRGDIDMAAALNSVATINVLNGGVLTMEQNIVGQRGVLAVGDADYATGIVNVDGANSKFFAGIAIIVSEGFTFTGQTSPAPLSGTSGTLNVKNGGLLDVNGDFELSPYAKADDGDNLTAVLNVGSGAADTTSVVDAAGVLLVGGRTEGSTPIAGSPAQVNLVNGRILTGDTAVYAGSTVNITRGVLSARLSAGGATGFISASGGKFIVSPSTPARGAVLVADHFETSLGGSIDIAKGGGVSIKATAADTDLADIKALIISNGIKSSAVTSPTGNVGIGYAPKGLRTSFDGYTFAAGEDAIVFGYTLKGDSDVSGTVDFDDLVSLAQNYLQAGTKEWYQGNFDYASGDTDVDFDDLVSLAQNYLSTASLDGVGSSQFQSDWALAQSLVPEPTTLGLLASAGIFAARRRRR